MTIPPQNSEEGEIFEFYPEFDDPSGNSYMQNVRHWIIRVAFVNILVQDPRVQTLYARWEKRSMLHIPAERIATMGRALATCFGYASLDELCEAAHAMQLPEKLSFSSQANLDAFRRTAHEFSALVSEYAASFDVAASFSADAVPLVRDDLQLPWPWVSMDLLRAFFFRAWNIMHADEMEFVISVLRPDPPAPKITLRFQTAPDEPTSEAIQRLDRFLKEVCMARRQVKHHLESALPSGVIPRDFTETRENLTRKAHWFYQHKCRQQSIRSLAKQYGNDWHTISDGIAEAERLLGLVPYSFR